MPSPAATTTAPHPASTGVHSASSPRSTRPRARSRLVDQPAERLEAEVIDLAGRLHAVTSLLPDAFVSLLLHDTERQPVDASPRRRFPTRRQRRVLDEISQECQHPGCHATAFLQYDHIHPYEEGGPTVLANLQRLCGPHNRARYQNSRPRKDS